MPISQQILLKSRPKGTPTQDNFEFQDVEVPAPAAGEVQVQNIYMSVDPYMRGRMRMQKPGDLLEGGAVGKILASNKCTGVFFTAPHLCNRELLMMRFWS